MTYLANKHTKRCSTIYVTTEFQIKMRYHYTVIQFSSVQWLSRVRLFVTPWTVACQASLSINNSQSLLKLMSNRSVIPSNYLIFCHPLLLLPSVFPSIRVFSNQSVLRIRWPKYWSWNSNTLATWWEELTDLKRPWCWERLRAGGEGDNRGWDGWMVSPTQWTWVWVDSKSCWWTGRPGVLRFMGLQRVGHNWTIELNWTEFEKY